MTLESKLRLLESSDGEVAQMVGKSLVPDISRSGNIDIFISRLCRVKIEYFKMIIDELVDKNRYPGFRFSNKQGRLLLDDVFRNEFNNDDRNQFAQLTYFFDKVGIDGILLFSGWIMGTELREQTVMRRLWIMAKDCDGVSMISKWMSVRYIVHNIRFLIEHPMWKLNDVYLLEKLMEQYRLDSVDNLEEFDRDGSESGCPHLLYWTCCYDQSNLLRYLMNKNICNETNYKEKLTRRGHTCLDIALLKNSDECVELLLKYFIYDFTSIYQRNKTSRSIVNSLASRKLVVLKMYHENGMELNIPDENGWTIVHHILARPRSEVLPMLKYVIENSICSFDQLLNLEYCGAEDPPLLFAMKRGCTKEMRIICNMIVENKTYNVKYNTLKGAILHDLDQVLSALLRLLLRRQGITSIESYHPNSVVTFEFVFGLLKLCVKTECIKLLKHWLGVIIQYHCKLSSISKDNDISMKYNYNHENKEV